MTEFNIKIMPRQSGKTNELKRIYRDLVKQGYKPFYVVPSRNMKDKEIPSRTFEELRVYPNDILLLDEILLMSYEKIERYAYMIKTAKLVYIRTSPYDSIKNLRLLINKEDYPEYFI